MDTTVTPLRGQLVIVENESHGMSSLSGGSSMDDGVGECCYVIGRPAGEPMPCLNYRSYTGPRNATNDHIMVHQAAAQH
jgi:hypothetical protein